MEVTWKTSKVKNANKMERKTWMVVKTEYSYLYQAMHLET